MCELFKSIRKWFVWQRVREQIECLANFFSNVCQIDRAEFECKFLPFLSCILRLTTVFGRRATACIKSRASTVEHHHSAYRRTDSFNISSKCIQCVLIAESSSSVQHCAAVSRTFTSNHRMRSCRDHLRRLPQLELSVFFILLKLNS